MSNNISKQLSEEILQKDFNINRYMGKWYQIASLPTFFQENCSNSTANYSQTNSDYIKVVNKCYNHNNSNNYNSIVNTIEGEARVYNNKYPAALVVTFDNITSSNIPNYLVHFTDYDNYSIVGSLDRQTLFVLSRQSSISKCTYDLLRDRSKNLGYNINNLVVDNNSLYDCLDNCRYKRQNKNNHNNNLCIIS